MQQVGHNLNKIFGGCPPNLLYENACWQLGWHLYGRVTLSLIMLIVDWILNRVMVILAPLMIHNRNFKVHLMGLKRRNQNCTVNKLLLSWNRDLIKELAGVINKVTSCLILLTWFEFLLNARAWYINLGWIWEKHWMWTMWWVIRWQYFLSICKHCLIRPP